MPHPDVIAWRAAGKHLPRWLRDFHAQKGVFRTMHSLTQPQEGTEETIHWMDGHIYVVDTFLWFMARHGYTLQKSRARLPFDDLSVSIEHVEARETAIWKQLLLSRASAGVAPVEPAIVAPIPASRPLFPLQDALHPSAEELQAIHQALAAGDVSVRFVCQQLSVSEAQLVAWLEPMSS